MAPGGVARFVDITRRYVQPRFLFHLPCSDADRTTLDNFLAKAR